MTQIPAGWYNTPDGVRRYWDGAKWTDAVAPAAPAAPAPAAPAPAQPLAAPAQPMQAQPIAAPPYQVPMPSQPAPQAQGARRKRKIWPWVLGIVLGFLAIIGGLIVWAITALVGVVTEPVDAVNNYWDAYLDGDCAAMQELTTEAYREQAGWDTCDGFLAQVPSDTDGVTFNANNVSTTNGVTTVTADVHLPGRADVSIITFVVVKEDGVWLVDGAEAS